MSELTEEVEFIAEANDKGGKSLFIKGIFMQAEQPNRNKRIYPMGVLEPEVNRYIKEYVQKNRAFGELGHPQGPTINPERISHMITELKRDGNNFVGKAKITDTPYGNIVKNLMNDGAKFGVSSRGMGSLKERNGINEVQKDFYLATAADIVTDPSAPDAFVDGVMEGVEWIFTAGTWVPRFVEESQKLVHSTNRNDLERVKLEIFENYINSISKNL